MNIVNSKIRTALSLLVVLRTGATVFADLVDGVRYARSEPAISGLLLLGTLPGLLFIGPFAVTVPLVVPDIFHASDKWVGILWGCFGAGVLAGSLILTLRPLPVPLN